MTTVVAAVIVRDSSVLICQRQRDKAFPLKWEFPGGKVEGGESLPEALIRELQEELRVQADVGPELFRTEHKYAGRVESFEIIFFVARIPENAKLEASAAF
ncbi:MAG: NUDIX domain-containing protein [Bryobacteraceae bacterium]